MSIGKCLIVAAALALLGCSPKPEPATHAPLTAWWVDIQFEPGTAKARGFDARSVDDRWKRMSVLDSNILKRRIPEAEIEKLKKSGFSFSLKADLDRDGVQEDFFVGVYETIDGEPGRFVAIARNGRIVKHFHENGTAGFSALLRGDREVRWYKCMECDSFDSIIWTGEGYSIE